MIIANPFVRMRDAHRTFNWIDQALKLSSKQAPSCGSPGLPWLRSSNLSMNICACSNDTSPSSSSLVCVGSTTFLAGAELVFFEEAPVELYSCLTHWFQIYVVGRCSVRFHAKTNQTSFPTIWLDGFANLLYVLGLASLPSRWKGISSSRGRQKDNNGNDLPVEGLKLLLNFFFEETTFYAFILAPNRPTT